MSHSLTRIWVHSILGTKGRKPLMNDNIRKDLCLQIQQEMEKTGCGVRDINGINNHIHVLFLLPKALSIAQVMKAIKGESSHWVNQNDMTQVIFAWQVGYGAFSVSESALGKVEYYIQNQQEHHRAMTYSEEYKRLKTHD